MATAASSSQINLSWSDVQGETGFRIERSLDGVSGWTQVGTTGANVVTFSNTGLSASTRYYYRVFANGAGGNSAASTVASAVTQSLALPVAPSNVVAIVVSKGKIRVTWTDNATNETGFHVQRSKDGRTWSTVATLGANSTTYTDTGLKTGTFYYRVGAYNAAGETASGQVAYASMGQIAKRSAFSMKPIRFAALPGLADLLR